MKTNKIILKQWFCNKNFNAILAKGNETQQNFGIVKQETEKAILIQWTHVLDSAFNKKTNWVPKSCVELIFEATEDDLRNANY